MLGFKNAMFSLQARFPLHYLYVSGKQALNELSEMIPNSELVILIFQIFPGVIKHNITKPQR